jgi:Zn-dependent protease with chaperone function
VASWVTVQLVVLGAGALYLALLPRAKGLTKNHATAPTCIDDPLQHHESWYHRLYDTHPSIEERIPELEKLAVGQTV